MAILRVGETRVYKTINEAYNVAYHGDVLWIDEGIYKEQLIMAEKSVHLIGNIINPAKGKVIIIPPVNKVVLSFSNIPNYPTIIIEGVYLKLPTPAAYEVIRVTNCFNVNVIFNRCIIDASLKWEYVFQCYGNDLESITLNNCKVIWKDDKEYGSSGAYHFVREAVDVNFNIYKSILSNNVENIDTSKFTSSTLFDYVLRREQIGYGPYYGTYRCDVPFQYYFSGSVQDVISDNIKLDTVELESNDSCPEIVLSSGNRRASLSISDGYIHRVVKSTFGKTTGKWYWEVKPFTHNYLQRHRVGVGTEKVTFTDPVGGIDGQSFGQEVFSGNFYYKNQSNSSGESVGYDDIIGVALDLSNGKIWWSRNGVWSLNGDPGIGTNPVFTGLKGEFFPMISLYTSYFDSNVDMVFSPEDLVYSIPNGFEFYSGNVTWKIKLFNSNTNNLIDSTFSDPLINTYYITTTYSGEHFIICEDADEPPTYNDLIFSKMSPKELI